MRLGDIEIARIVEQEGPFRPALDVLPALTPDVLADNRAWMRELGALDPDDVLILSMQSFLVRTPHHTILVDSCIGNDKNLPTRPAWHNKQDTRFMAALSQAGVSVEQIDYVLCTHLHVDHVGWNTRLENGRWIPTFPKARYVFGKTEYAHWERENLKTANTVFTDSVLPIVEAGRAELVEFDHGIGDHVRFMPTIGHTPGHMSVQLGRNGEAVVSGDLVHSPLQARYPEMSILFDTDQDQAAKTRRSFFERYAGTPTVCCMTHFPSPSLFKLEPWGNGFRCDAA
jgi:glyoxylase-like metal-dependent hydrolase (beta-lactamase superfamily II)